jgi:hypothetical protein
MIVVAPAQAIMAAATAMESALDIVGPSNGQVSKPKIR